MRSALSTIVFFISLAGTSAHTAELKCRITPYALAPHQSSSANAIDRAKESSVSDWRQCYLKAVEASKEYGYSIEDYTLVGGSGDFFSGDPGTPMLRGYIFYFISWAVNDSLVGFLNGSSGQVNEFSPREPAAGDRRRGPDGGPF